MTQLIARIDAFTKSGKFVPRGGLVTTDEVDFDAKDDNGAFIKAPSGLETLAVVEVSAIAPTGPNPQNPQQIASDAMQTVEGYVQGGARLVGEVTVPEKQRIEIVGIGKNDDSQAKIAQALADADADMPSADAAGPASKKK